MSFDTAEIIAAGKASGISAEAMLDLLQALASTQAARVDAAALTRRARDADRKRRVRNVRADTLDNADSVDTPSPLCPPFPSPDPNPYPPISPQPQPSSSSGERELERECRQIVGAEPVALAQDFAALAAIQSEGVTAADIVAGVRAAMACDNFRPMAWRQMIGWARRAAKDRLGGAAKIVGSPPARAPPTHPAKVTVFQEMLAKARQEAAGG